MLAPERLLVLLHVALQLALELLYNLRQLPDDLARLELLLLSGRDLLFQARDLAPRKTEVSLQSLAPRLGVAKERAELSLGPVKGVLHLASLRLGCGAGLFVELSSQRPLALHGGPHVLSSLGLALVELRLQLLDCRAGCLELLEEVTLRLLGRCGQASCAALCLGLGLCKSRARPSQLILESFAVSQPFSLFKGERVFELWEGGEEYGR